MGKRAPIFFGHRQRHRPNQFFGGAVWNPCDVHVVHRTTPPQPTRLCQAAEKREEIRMQNAIQKEEAFEGEGLPRMSCNTPSKGAARVNHLGSHVGPGRFEL